MVSGGFFWVRRSLRRSLPLPLFQARNGMSGCSRKLTKILKRLCNQNTIESQGQCILLVWCLSLGVFGSNAPPSVHIMHKITRHQNAATQRKRKDK